jgi:hypothetical protein
VHVRNYSRFSLSPLCNKIMCGKFASHIPPTLFPSIFCFLSSPYSLVFHPLPFLLPCILFFRLSYSFFHHLPYSILSFFCLPSSSSLPYSPNTNFSRLPLSPFLYPLSSSILSLPLCSLFFQPFPSPIPLHQSLYFFILPPSLSSLFSNLLHSSQSRFSSILSFPPRLSLSVLYFPPCSLFFLPFLLPFNFFFVSPSSSILSFFPLLLKSIPSFPSLLSSHLHFFFLPIIFLFVPSVNPPFNSLIFHFILSSVPYLPFCRTLHYKLNRPHKTLHKFQPKNCFRDSFLPPYTNITTRQVQCKQYSLIQGPLNSFTMIFLMQNVFFHSLLSNLLQMCEANASYIALIELYFCREETLTGYSPFSSVFLK